MTDTDELMHKDCGMLVNNAMNWTVLLEIFDDRSSGKATVLTSQLPIAHYYALIGGTKILEAMLTGP